MSGSIRICFLRVDRSSSVSVAPQTACGRRQEKMVVTCREAWKNVTYTGGVTIRYRLNKLKLWNEPAAAILSTYKNVRCKNKLEVCSNLMCFVSYPQLCLFQSKIYLNRDVPVIRPAKLDLFLTLWHVLYVSILCVIYIETFNTLIYRF
jgi:hypothetical protein